MIFLSVPLCVLFSMLGGQINKLFRPIGIPLSIIGIYLMFNIHTWYFCLPVLLYAVIDTLGYGPNSKLEKWLKSDELVRIVFGILSCIPILIIFLLRGHFITIIGCVAPIVAYQLREGSWGKIGKYDILPDDLFRGLLVSLAVSWALL